ncbi:hypothetical protein [Alteromonas sp. a30]|uniref:hypothetical protein n=1 Tax=Alteromonas sp. a30 TaxID=2730917 RepID=UPI00227E9BDB|nr:hypothetical protein [Alteromonas sp. a30]MCY7297500.1 hypothetical protein [Alteromonas sp. a30]
MILRIVALLCIFNAHASNVIPKFKPMLEDELNTLSEVVLKNPSKVAAMSGEKHYMDDVVLSYDANFIMEPGQLYDDGRTQFCTYNVIEVFKTNMQADSLFFTINAKARKAIATNSKLNGCLNYSGEELFFTSPTVKDAVAAEAFRALLFPNSNQYSFIARIEYADLLKDNDLKITSMESGGDDVLVHFTKLNTDLAHKVRINIDTKVIEHLGVVLP